jgi:TonB-dependent starch-binding outer membrane protein SusC
MKKLNCLHWTTLIKVCSEKTFRIIKLATLLFMVTVLNVFGSNAFNANPDPGKEAVPALVMQQNRITGTVTDENGNPLPGVNVQVEGTTLGAISDVNGKYAITSPNRDASLIFTFVGYSVQKVPVSGRNVIDINMVPDIKSLGDVVVIGYGVQRKSDLTGAVGSVKAETLQERPTTSVSQALAGRITGVNVSINSGRPGGKPNIRIRGNTSISITNDPLYIVDGVISSIDYINPNDIASIEVLKDASATAIYGARGSNGVIIVTTKRGSSDGGKVSYSTELSVGKLPREIPVLNSKQYLNLEDVSYINAQKFDPTGWAAGKYTDPKLKRTNPLLFDASGNPLYDTDWQKEATQNAFSQNHNLSFSGGDAKNNYGVYLGYRDEEGLIKSSYLKRFSGRFVFDSQIKTWLKVGGSLNYIDQKENQIDFGSSGIEVLREILEQLPIIPIKFPDGSWASNENYPNVESAPNPIQVLTDRTNIFKTANVIGNVYATITLAKGLELRTTFGTNITDITNNLYAGRNLNFISRSQGGQATVSNSKSRYWQTESYLTYNKKVSDIHSFTGLLGVSWQHSDYYNFRAANWNFSDDFFQTNNLGVGSNPQTPASGTSAYGLNSYFGRINYGLKEKYYLTLSGRVDGSSKFGASNRFAFFPSAALAWRTSEEEFIKNIPAISNLKFRASYGETGNSEIAAYQALAGLSSYGVIFSDTRATGIGVGRLPNSALQWEKTGQADLGLELGLFKSRISLEVDLYNKLTTNMLLAAPVPTTSGYSTVTKNIGSMRNRGIEFTLTTANVSLDDFSWTTAFNISVNRNKVISTVNNNSDVFPGPSYVSETNIARVGEPMGSFYGYVRLGTWGTDEAAKAATYNKKPGDLKFLDVNNDNTINSLDRVIIGKGIPDGFGSFMNTLRYKNLDLVLDIQFMYGNDVLVLEKYVQEYRTGIANSRATVLDAWTPDNQDAVVAQWRPTTAGYDGQQDSRMVEDGSFIRGRNLLLGYNFSSDFTKKMHLYNLRLTASVQNLFLITKYTGYDPETSTRNETYGQGIINFDYPKPRVYMFGLYVSF